MGKKLKIAFDAKRLFHNKEGLGTYARTLVEDLQENYPEHDYILCTPSLSNEDFAEPFRDKSKYSILTAGANVPGALWRSKTIVTDLEKAGVDIYLGLSNELPYGIQNSVVKSIVTIHDVLFREFPQQFSIADRWIYKKKFQHALQASDHVMATSRHTKSDIIKHFAHQEDKITVAYQPVSSIFRTAPFIESHEKRHYLFVGTINARKNLEYILEAYSLLPKNQLRKLVVVGEGKAYKQKMKELSSQYQLEEWIDFVGNVSDLELLELYQQAIGLIFPSKYEGFGRPLLEALTLRIPVITGRNSSLPEVVGKYGTIIEYDRAELLVAAIEKHNKSTNGNDRFTGLENHLDKFSPENHSNLIMSLLRAL